MQRAWLIHNESELMRSSGARDRREWLESLWQIHFRDAFSGGIAF